MASPFYDKLIAGYQPQSGFKAPQVQQPAAPSVSPDIGTQLRAGYQPRQGLAPAAPKPQPNPVDSGYYKVGQDVFNSAGQHIDLPTFQSLGLNYDHLPSRPGGAAPVTPPATTPRSGSTAAPQIPVPPQTPDAATLAGIQKMAEGAANNGGVATTTPGQMAAGAKTQQQQLMEKAINYYLGYDTSPEAQRILELKKSLGGISGGLQTALAQIQQMPGLTSLISGRQTSVAQQAAGSVAAPLQAELEALTESRTSQSQNMQQLLNIAKSIEPNIIGSPIQGEDGSVSILKQDPMTGNIETISLGQIGKPATRSGDLGEYDQAKKEGFQGNFLDFKSSVAQRTRATSEIASSIGGQAGDYAGYLYNQILSRQLELSSLPADEKKLALAMFAKMGTPIPRPLTLAQKTAADESIGGLAAIEKAKMEVQKSPGVVAKSQWLGPLATLAGAGAYKQAIETAQGQFQKVQSGLAMTDSEREFYAGIIKPKTGESAEGVRDRLNQFKALFQGASGIPVQLYSPDGQNSVQFTDLFDGKERLQLRQYVNNGWLFEEDLEVQ